MNTPINTHFNVTDQELAAANGGNIILDGPAYMMGGLGIYMGYGIYKGYQATKRAERMKQKT